MRLVFASAVALCLFAAAALAADTAGEKAIKDAIALLEARGKRAKGADFEMIVRAMDALKAAMKPPPPPPPAIKPGEKPVDITGDRLSDFLDHPEKYKGQVLKANLEIEQAFVRAPGPSIRDVDSVRLVPIGFDLKGLILVTIPKGIDVPKAHDGDKLTITFRCAAGDTTTGNSAVAIERLKAE